MEQLAYPKPKKLTKEEKREKAIKKFVRKQKDKVFSQLTSKKTKKKALKKLKRNRPLKNIIKEADSVFSKWIRERDGWKCVLCGSTKNIQNGHFFRRGKKILRWDEKNCHALCSSCNYRDNFEHDHYIQFFVKKYGLEEYNRLYTLVQNNLVWKPSRDYLNDIIKKYGSHVSHSHAYEQDFESTVQRT